MRKSVLTIFVSVLSLSLYAQTITDVVRYGTENLLGTARFQALSGAYGALGADMSGININPAGSAVFSSSKSTMTGTYTMFENTTSYFGNENMTDDNGIDMNQIGGVFVFDIGKRDAKWKKITLAINYDQTANYTTEFYASGPSDFSIDQYFMFYANGKVPLGDILQLPGESILAAYANIGSQLGYTPQQAFLGLQAGIINSTDDSNTSNTAYVPNTGAYATLNQEFRLLSEGGNSKFTVNLASQISNFYVGASVNYHTIRYERLTQFSESGYDPAFTPLEYMYFDNFINVNGNAFSFTVGAISKIKDRFRVGVAYQSPISYTLTEELSQYITSNTAPFGLEEINPSNIVNIFPEYKIHIPGKITGSAAVIFGKHGLISFDYDYQDFSSAQLRPGDDPGFQVQNSLISTRLKAASGYRIGAEYRAFKQKRLSLRAGYRIQESPYVNTDTMGNLSGYSFGLGYNFGGTQIDASFNQFQRDQDYHLFDPGFINRTGLNSKNTNVALSLSYRL